jgi:hypothetical protein
VTSAASRPRPALKPKTDWLPLARAVIGLRAGANAEYSTPLDQLADLLKEKTGAAARSAVKTQIFYREKPEKI